jgi:RHS repeat-associated protein
MTSGNSQRLQQFVTNLYYGALQRDPTSTELQNGVNQLAAAGVQGQSQLQTSAAQLARSLFTSTNYETSPSRTDQQYVADLYNAYLQRGADSSGLGFWTGQAAGGVTNRTNVCNAFEASGEFQTLVATLYGTATSDNQRTESFVNNFYLGAYGRNATSTELQTNRDSLNAAAAIGQSQVQTQAEAMGRGLFASQVTNTTMTDAQYVTNLYEGFLQRGADSSGMSFWTGQAAGGSTNRQHVLDAFATCTAFRSLTATLYRESYWLVSDHLGTPRMVVDKSGSLGGIKRHDYLPFGEELSAGTGGRTTSQGYFQLDGVRQGLTGYEKDAETGLSFAQARYYSPAQGRFLSVDPENAGADEQNPQSWNGYAYVLNKPNVFVDPDGQKVILYDEHHNKVGEISDEEANAGLFNQEWQIKNHHYVDNGTVYDWDGNVIGYYENTCCDWLAGSWQEKVVQELEKPETWIRAVPGAVINVATKGISSGTKGAANWAAGIQKYGHGDMTVIEHIFYRHGPQSGFGKVSRFSLGTSVRDVKNLVDEAVTNGTRSGNSIVYDFGRVIGTSPSGQMTTKLKIYLNSAGEVRTAFPF